VTSDPRVDSITLFSAKTDAKSTDSIPSSSPAFDTPVHPIRTQSSIRHSKPSNPSSLPILLPPAILRPLAFRTFTKKHNLTLTSSALQLLATFIGTHCGSAWREKGLAEQVLDDIAKLWKKNGGGVIVGGEDKSLTGILRNVESSIVDGHSARTHGPDRQQSLIFCASKPSEDLKARNGSPGFWNRESNQAFLGLPALHLGDHDEGGDGADDNDMAKDPRQWLRLIQAFEQPRLWYNGAQKHFEVIGKAASLFPDPSHKTQLFRHRYNLVHQRLLRNESFQTSSLSFSQNSMSNQMPSDITSVHQAYKLTPIANLLGRNGSSHLLLGILTISPAGNLVIGDLSGSIALDTQHARPIPEEAAWYTPGMVVLVDGIYEEEGAAPVPIIGTDGGIGGTIGGKFIALSLGGPPCERREVSLGVGGISAGNNSTTGAGFGWVDFLGIGSERASGIRMRNLEQKILNHNLQKSNFSGRGTIVIMGEVDLTRASILQALRKVLATYAMQSSDQTPMSFVLMGNFVRFAVMAGGGSGGSIEYKEYFDSLAMALSDYPTILQTATFIFVPGDNDPWASAFSAGAATILPRPGIPEIFTTRIKRAFATANKEEDHSGGRKAGGEPIWSSNPARISLFGPAQEIVLFRDNMISRLQRNALKFSPLNEEPRVTLEPVQLESPSQPSSFLAKDQILGKSNKVDRENVAEPDAPASRLTDDNTATSSDISIARKLVKTILDQGYLSPFPMSTRPVLWDYAGALQLYPLPSALVLTDPEAPAFAVTYEGCHVMNPGALVPDGRRGIAQWMEYNSRTRRGKMREIRI
jgi:DNA polymerase epsilon subunit 2